MMRALMIGFGSVGRALARMIDERRGHLGGMGLNVSAIGIFTRSRGNVVDPGGVDLGQALAEVEREGRFMGDTSDLTPLEACREMDYDVLLELSPLTIAERGEPAVSHIRAALSRGRDVVTANKGPVAFAYNELNTLAHEYRCSFRFESAVMDGAPVFNLVERCMKGNRVTGFSGILNSTTNYILTRMEEGVSLAEATEEAIASGSAEADPSNDIDGWDAATKVAVLARVLLGADVSPFDVAREGIRGVTPGDIRAAASRGRRLKLICRGAHEENGGVSASVKVEAVERGHLFAAMSAHDSVICIESELMAPNCIVQLDPSPRDTAYGVLEDMLSLQRK